MIVSVYVPVLIYYGRISGHLFQSMNLFCDSKELFPVTDASYFRRLESRAI